MVDCIYLQLDQLPKHSIAFTSPALESLCRHLQEQFMLGCPELVYCFCEKRCEIDFAKSACTKCLVQKRANLALQKVAHQVNPLNLDFHFIAD